jgi:hypothetical protein
MEANPIVAEGLKVAGFYYGAQRYFAQLVYLAEGVASLLGDRGWKITTRNSGKQIFVEQQNWKERGALLPREYGFRFVKATVSDVQATDEYCFRLWFFPCDPEGEQPWVPTGYFYRATLVEGATFDQEWRVGQLIPEASRNQLLAPEAEVAFLRFTAPWPRTFAGSDIMSQIRSLEVIPFPLASVKSSEDLEFITLKAVRALSESDPTIVTRDPEYLRRVWAL